MKASRIVSLSLVIILAVVAFGSFVDARPAQAISTVGKSEKCEALNNSALDGTYGGHYGVYQLNAGNTVTIAWTNALLSSFPYIAYYSSGASDNDPITTESGSYSFTAPSAGLYEIEWLYDATWTVSATCGTAAPAAPSAPGYPPAVFWPGHPDSPDYDGRINAEPADRYVVYCVSGQLQVWDGKTNVKMGALNYADVSAMPDPGNQQIGDTVFLGRSGNILTVNIGPGVWIKDNIKLDKCVAGGYKGK